MTQTIIKVSRNTEQAPVCPLSSQTVAFSHYNNISAQLPIDVATGQLVAADIETQTKQCLLHIKSIVESIDHVLDDVVKVNIFLKNIADIDAVNAIYTEFFNNLLPTRNCVVVDALPLEGALIQVDALISNGEGTAPQAPCDLAKLSRNTNAVPADSAATQTVAFSHYNNISAQLPIDPISGEKVVGGIKEQTAQCLANIKTILTSIDVPADDIVKTTVYLKNLADIDAVNEVYNTFFPDSAIARAVAYVPARTVVSANDLPLDALVQIDAVVSHGDGTPPQEIEDRHGIVIRSKNTLDAPLCANSTQTVAFSHYNHISAQLPVIVTTNELIAGDITAQANQCLTHIKTIVESINHQMDDIVKVNIQLRNIADVEQVNEVYTRFFNGELPARTVVGVGEIAKDALVQIDAVVSNAEGTPPQ